MPLSEKKIAFLQKPQSSRKLAASEINPIISHYQNKHNITIYKNGETLKSQELIEKKKIQLEKDYNDVIQELSGDEKYLKYVERVGFYFERFSVHEYVIGKENHRILNNILKGYLDNNMSLTCSDTLEFKNLNQKIKEHIQLSKVLDIQIEKYILHWIEKKNNAIKDCCLSAKESLEEIRTIQATLGENEFVGYIYTNGVSVSGGHFEVIIINREAVVKPISWYNLSKWYQLQPDNFKEWYSIQLKQSEILTLDKFELDVPVAQGSHSGCGTLGLLYLKELLKNEAQQLKEYSLMIPYYNSEKILNYFFFPSPHVLRYSQSSTYNKLIVAMLEDSEELQPILKKNKTYQIMTLKALLKKSMHIAEQNGDFSTKERNQKILEALPAFRKQWLDVYSRVSEMLKEITDSYQQEREKQATYLAYASHRMAKLFSTSVKPQESLPSVKIEKLEQQEQIRNPVPSQVTKEIILSENLQPVLGEKPLSIERDVKHEESKSPVLTQGLFSHPRVPQQSMAISNQMNVVQTIQSLDVVQDNEKGVLSSEQLKDIPASEIDSSTRETQDFDQSPDYCTFALNERWGCLLQ